MTKPAAYLAHYPLSAALKAHAAREPLPRWELHPVDVEAARPWADMLHTLRRINPRVAFPGRADVVEAARTVDEVRLVDITLDPTSHLGNVDKIAAPDERTANASPVEQPAGEDERLPSGSSPAKTYGDSNYTSPSPTSGSHTPVYDLDRFGRPILPPADDGDDADPAAVAVLKARYAALEGDGRLWVNAVAKGAQAAGGALSLADSQPQSIRRFEAMRALVLLADGGFADDDAVRGILRPILGDVADMAAFTIGKLVAALGADEAARFARLADTVANGSVALSVKLDGRYEWEFAA